MACVNWDMLIVKYNIEKCKTAESKSKIDIAFMVSRSDQTLPILKENQKYFETDMERLFSNEMYLDNRIEKYLKEQKKYSWVSWNYADASTVSLLEKK